MFRVSASGLWIHIWIHPARACDMAMSWVSCHGPLDIALRFTDVCRSCDSHHVCWFRLSGTVVPWRCKCRLTDPWQYKILWHQEPSSDQTNVSLVIRSHTWRTSSCHQRGLFQRTVSENSSFSVGRSHEISVSQDWYLNSLWPGDAIWQPHRIGLTSNIGSGKSVMACHLTAPSHHLNQCRLISQVQTKVGSLFIATNFDPFLLFCYQNW